MQRSVKVEGDTVVIEGSAGPCVMMTNPGIRHPILVIESLSPSNHAETWRNIRAYMLIPSVREILVIHTGFVGTDLLRRDNEGAWPDDVTPVTEGTFSLASLDLTLPLGALYRRSGVG